LSSRRTKLSFSYGKKTEEDMPVDAITRTSVSLKPLIADQWVVSSLLQKSIRRGDVETAQRAALTLLAQKGSALWRRLMVIAFEDVGAGSPDVLASTIAVSTDPNSRKANGGDLVTALEVTRALAEAPKDRSADYLICGAKDHPSLENVRTECAQASIAQRLDAVADLNRPLEQRAVFAWYASGQEWGAEKRVGKGELPALLDTFRSLRVPELLVGATGVAARRTREPIVLLVPLIWLAAAAGKASATVVDASVPDGPAIGGVPLYALDKHSRLGREAIGRFAMENEPVRACLRQHVRERRRRDAALMAAFYTDATPIVRRLVWPASVELEAFGTENDLLVAGVPKEGHAPLLQAFRANLAGLNAVRSEVFERWRAVQFSANPQSQGGC
jgi:hypothetical protein